MSKKVYKYSRKEIAKMGGCKEYIVDQLLALADKPKEECRGIGKCKDCSLIAMSICGPKIHTTSDGLNWVEPTPLKTKPEIEKIKRLKYVFNPNTLDIKLFGTGDPISIIVKKLDEVIFELNKLIINSKK